MLLSVVLTTSVFASPVDPQRAIQVAQQFVPQSSSAQRAPMRGAKSEPTSTIVYTHMMPGSDRAAFYIINVGDAFVIVSADDVAHQILGYNTGKKWPVSKDGTIELPEHIKGFFDDLALQIETATKAKPNSSPDADWTGSSAVIRSPQRGTPNLPDSIGPLLTTTWDQGQYYNSLCPEDVNGPDGHAQNGCVATAMAQIIKYWGDSVQIRLRGTHSYDSNYGTLTVDYNNESYDYANMPNELTAESTPEQVAAVAKLMYHCGIATNMSYGATESSAYDVDARAGLINFFLFSPDIIHANKANYSEEKWNEMLKENIASYRPIMYSGHGDTGGHSFICDGYKADNYYHFNFGWGGFADGWYLTSAVNPLGIEYNYSQAAILNIVPDENGNVIFGQYIGKSTYYVDEPLFFSNPYHSVYEENRNQVTFVLPEENGHLICDVLDFDESVIQYININQWYRRLTYNDFGNNDYSSIETNGNTMTFDIMGRYDGNDGFLFYIHQDDGCNMITSVSLENNKDDNTGTTVSIAWTDDSNSGPWQIRYRDYGTNLDSASIINVSTNPYILSGLSKGELYYISVRNQHGIDAGIWSKEYCILVDIPHWTDIVTEQPAGYVEDANGNVEISTAEGLAWLSVKSNGLHNQQKDNYLNKKIRITADIDLSGYRWLPIACNLSYPDAAFYGVLDGENHSICNMYIAEDKTERCGLISFFRQGEIKNVILKDGIVNNFYYSIPEQSASGGLVGENIGGKIDNCHSTIVIKGLQAIGGICGYSTGTIINSSSCGDIYGRAMCGGLVGHSAPGSDINNCYSSTNIWSNYSVNPLYCTAYRAYRGGLIGYAENSVIENCYSVGSVESETGNYTSGVIIGCPCYSSELKYLYGLLNDDLNLFGYEEERVVITDTSSFTLNDGNCALLSSVCINEEYYTDMIEAMNAWITNTNNPSYKLWVKDNNTNNGYPIFGNYFEPSCYNPTNLTISNSTIVGDPTIQTKFAWDQIGTPTRWDILYVPARHSIDDGIIVSVNSNPCILTDLPIGKPLDFYIRAINNEDDKSGWSEPITYIPDKLYWTDVVTECPEGYVEDTNGDIHIYTSEGLAWLAHVVNEEYAEKRNIILESDIDINQYRWTPIGTESLPFIGNFNGNGHCINGLYCNELNNYVGLLGHAFNYHYYSSIKDLYLTNCFVSGESYVGAIAGSFGYGEIINCSVQGEINAYACAGGLIAEGPSITIKNSCFNGFIKYRNDIYSYLIPGYYGGIVDYSYNATVENCFVAGQIPNMNYSGLITGTGTDAYSVTNCYGLQDSSGIPFTSSLYTDNLSYFDVNGSSCILNNPPFINGEYYNDLLSALNAWVDANNTDGQYRHWVADTANVNGGFPIFAPIYNLTYKVDGEIYKIRFVEPGTELNDLDTPTKEGYTFSGWSEIPAVMPANDVEVNGKFVVNKYLLQVLIDGEVVYSDSIIYGSRLAGYVDLITNQGIDLSQWEFYDQIATITMPAHDVIINAVPDGIMPIMMDEENAIIYDLTGRRINTNEISTMPDGIYLINERKYQIRR